MAIIGARRPAARVVVVLDIGHLFRRGRQRLCGEGNSDGVADFWICMTGQPASKATDCVL
ncbi:hypothetical protein OLX02_11290 [Novosphingobium sp. KCTC 2891]|uniref:hypothetical protein n=1 Tax=Novosphingobium sp. KCTC 2891 TaxID=2989730 RepID=UPI00222152E7|nr:hypothetical protein [Novosphingobium sp. KCTC 2891]MCW1383404.1 hypothetical protein [Novosphingobium sp. KCTC 2891]